MPSRESSTGLRAALGVVRLTLMNQPPAFRRDGRSSLTVDIEPPGAVVGRHERADVMLCGGDDELYVSNFHLLIEPSGGLWVARDNGSTHGTVAHERTRGRVALRPHQPLPLVDGMEIELAGVARVRVALVALGDVVPTLPPRGGAAAGAPAWIVDADQRELAELLTAPRRRGRTERVAAEDVAQALHCSATKAHNVRRALARHREVERHLDADAHVTFLMLADALALAFPYLVEPRSDPDPR